MKEKGTKGGGIQIKRKTRRTDTGSFVGLQ